MHGLAERDADTVRLPTIDFNTYPDALGSCSLKHESMFVTALVAPPTSALYGPSVFDGIISVTIPPAYQELACLVCPLQELFARQVLTEALVNSRVVVRIIPSFCDGSCFSWLAIAGSLALLSAGIPLRWVLSSVTVAPSQDKPGTYIVDPGAVGTRAASLALTVPLPTRVHTTAGDGLTVSSDCSTDTKDLQFIRAIGPLSVSELSKCTQIALAALNVLNGHILACMKR